MSRPLAILLICTCTTFADGWSTNWPSQANPRAGKIHLSEAYTAIVERCQATGTTLPTAPTWYRFARTDLINLKTNLTVLIPKFVDQGNKTGAAGNYTNWFLANSNSTALPVYAATTLLAQCQMPTNWLVWTPWRSISGLGGNTNDWAVLYPYGYTNATTAAGGTNYPAGRSTWYDTDYGYGSVTTLLARLTDIQKTPVATTNFAGTSSAGYDWAKTNTYAAISAGIDAYWTNDQSWVEVWVLGECSQIQNWSGYNYAYKSQGQWSYGLTNVYTNCEVWVDWSMNVRPFRADVAAVDDRFGPTFTNVSFAFTSQAVNLLEQTAETAGSGWLTSSVFGSTNAPCGIGFGPSTPSYPTKPYIQCLGWEFRGTHHALLSYRFAFR